MHSHGKPQVAYDLLNVFAWSVSVRKAYLLAHYIALECDIRSCTLSTSITKRPAWQNHDFFSSSKGNNFKITISCFDKFFVGNSTLTFIAALCRLPQRYIVWHLNVQTFRSQNKQKKSFLRKVAVGIHFSLFPQPFSANFWVRKEINFGYSCFLCKSYTPDTDSLHSCTRLQATPRARDGLSVSLVQSTRTQTWFLSHIALVSSTHVFGCRCARADVCGNQQINGSNVHTRTCKMQYLHACRCEKIYSRNKSDNIIFFKYVRS